MDHTKSEGIEEPPNTNTVEDLNKKSQQQAQKNKKALQKVMGDIKEEARYYYVGSPDETILHSFSPLYKIKADGAYSQILQILTAKNYTYWNKKAQEAQNGAMIENLFSDLEEFNQCVDYLEFKPILEGGKASVNKWKLFYDPDKFGRYYKSEQLARKLSDQELSQCYYSMFLSTRPVYTSSMELSEFDKKMQSFTKEQEREQHEFFHQHHKLVCSQRDDIIYVFPKLECMLYTNSYDREQIWIPLQTILLPNIYQNIVANQNTTFLAYNFNWFDHQNLIICPCVLRPSDITYIPLQDIYVPKITKTRKVVFSKKSERGHHVHMYAPSQKDLDEILKCAHNYSRVIVFNEGKDHLHLYARSLVVNKDESYLEYQKKKKAEQEENKKS